MGRIVYPCTIPVKENRAGFRRGAQMHVSYHLFVADTMRQVRNLILQIADIRAEEFRFDVSHMVNASRFAAACGGIAHSTITRILRGERNVDPKRVRVRRRDPGDWTPSARLLDGLQELLGVTSRRQVWGAIERAPEPRADDPAALLWGRR